VREREKEKETKGVLGCLVWFNTSISEMPRPGPRPYECVRRAWHSERHQPVRGSIIQQIFRFLLLYLFPFFFSPLFSRLCIPLPLLRALCLFRVVVDAHSPATMKNKECQEKLPAVVLRAEEIMYSKANSEVFLVSQMLAECGFLDLSLCWVKPLLLNLL